MCSYHTHDKVFPDQQHQQPFSPLRATPPPVHRDVKSQTSPHMPSICDNTYRVSQFEHQERIVIVVQTRQDPEIDLISMERDVKPVNVSRRSMTRIALLVGLISSASTASYSICDASLALRISLYRDSATWLDGQK
jgi:hypothetical protein